MCGLQQADDERTMHVRRRLITNHYINQHKNLRSDLGFQTCHYLRQPAGIGHAQSASSCPGQDIQPSTHTHTHTHTHAKWNSIDRLVVLNQAGNKIRTQLTTHTSSLSSSPNRWCFAYRFIILTHALTLNWECSSPCKVLGAAVAGGALFSSPVPLSYMHIEMYIYNITTSSYIRLLFLGIYKTTLLFADN